MPKLSVTSAPILHPILNVNGVEIPAEALKITAEQIKELLGWETETEYLARMAADPANAKAKPEAIRRKFEFGDDYLLLDEDKNKVKCSYNLSNRPYRDGDSRKITQDILAGAWKLNGETLIIGATGQALSIQHRGPALIRAVQIWHKTPDKYPAWTEEPYLLSLIVYGISEENSTVQTIDNVVTRSESDVLYTSGAFAHLGGTDRKECTRMLAKAIDFLWQHTGADKALGGADVYKTHSEEMDFRQRHPKLDACVLHLFACNKDRALSNMRLSPGQSAAMLYLMGSSDTAIDDYRLAEPKPSEDCVKWGAWKRAKEFWEWAATAPKPLAEAMAKLTDPEQSMGGRTIEKAAVIASAWDIFKSGSTPKRSDLELDYPLDDNGERILNPAWTDFGGIDTGWGRPEAPEAVPTEEEIEAKKEELRQVAAAKTLAKLNEVRAKREGKGKTPEGVPSRPEGVPSRLVAANGHGGAAPGEVAKPKPVAVDKDGKPPVPRLLPKPLHKKDDLPKIKKRVTK